MSHFEHSELTKSAEPSSGDLASQALLADSMPPFKVAFKQEAKPLMLASNDAGSGCSTRDVPYSDDHHDDHHDNPKPPVEQPPVKPVEAPSFSQQQSEQQAQQQEQQQRAEAAAHAQAQAANRNDIANSNNLANRVESNNANTVGNTSNVANKVDAASANTNANNVNVTGGSTTYRSYSNARGEALPGNECQTFAGRLDGYFLGSGGAIGFSNSDEACIKAKAVKVNCDATVSMGVANEHNSAAEQSWLKVANSAQQAEIINHGIKNAQKISDNVLKKTAECATSGEVQESPPPPAPAAAERRSEVDTSNLVTKQELRETEQRQGLKLDSAFKHSMQK